jgi:hypothetical protein
MTPNKSTQEDTLAGKMGENGSGQRWPIQQLQKRVIQVICLCKLKKSPILG